MGIDTPGTTAPATRPGPRPNEWGPDAVAPDTVRDGGTAPLGPIAPIAPAKSGVPETVVATAPLARPPRRAAEPLTYEVYSPNDTLRGARPLAAASAIEARRRTFGMIALGIAVTLGTTLMAIGSCDDSATGRVETTAASVAPLPPSATPSATPIVPAPDVIPPIVFSPPLAPPPRPRRPRAR